MTTMTSSLQHPQFQATLETYAARTHAALPLANGRIEKAVDLVRSGGVTCQHISTRPWPCHWHILQCGRKSWKAEKDARLYYKCVCDVDGGECFHCARHSWITSSGERVR